MAKAALLSSLAGLFLLSGVKEFLTDTETDN
jgi:hypothetical protein